MDAVQYPHSEEIRDKIADVLGANQIRETVAEAVAIHLDDARSEVWRRRRAQFLHRLSVIERNLDYDLQVRGIA